jgi:hypothetical protein
VTVANPQYIRTPFEGNRIPVHRMNPIALKVLQDIPLPNQTGDPTTFQNNWLGGGVTENNKNYSLIGRLDHTIGSSWKMFGRFNKEHRDGGQIDYYGWDTAATQRSHGSERDDGAVVDLVGSLSPNTIFNTRFGVTWARQGSRDYPFDMASLGLPQDLLGQLRNPNRYPIFTFQEYLSTSRDEGNINSNVNYTAQAGLVKIVGSHSMKFGFEYRMLRAAWVIRATIVSVTGSWNAGRVSSISSVHSRSNVA